MRKRLLAHVQRVAHSNAAAYADASRDGRREREHFSRSAAASEVRERRLGALGRHLDNRWRLPQAAFGASSRGGTRIVRFVEKVSLTIACFTPTKLLVAYPDSAGNLIWLSGEKWCRC